MPGLPSWPRLMLLASIAGAVMTALYLLQYWDRKPPSLLPGTADPNRIDLYAEQIRGVKYDVAGRPVQTLHAARLEHFPVCGESVLTAPVLQSLGKDGELWNTTAATGVLIGDAEIRLRGDVEVTDSRKTMRFETEELSYFPERQEITTALPVKLSRFNDTTTATGMRADLGRNRVELLNKVNSIHVQP